MMKELFEYLNKKASSTIIFVFAVFWVMCHFQGFTAMIFTDQDLIFQKYGLLKNEYLQKYFFVNFCDLCFWIRNVLPFFLTWFYIWIMPKIVINRAYERQINYKVDRAIIKEQAQQRLIKERNETTKEEISSKKEQIRLAEENKKLENRTEEIWNREYNEFIKIPNYDDILSKLRYVIYERQGAIVDGYGANNIASEYLMVFDTNDLITINGKICSITDKGKFFLTQFYSKK